MQHREKYLSWDTCIIVNDTIKKNRYIVGVYAKLYVPNSSTPYTRSAVDWCCCM